MLRRLLAALRRVRLAIAESDLRWMEARARADIAHHRAQVLALQARCNVPPRVCNTSAAAIAELACREKRGMLKFPAAMTMTPNA